MLRTFRQESNFEGSAPTCLNDEQHAEKRDHAARKAQQRRHGVLVLGDKPGDEEA